VSVVGLEVLCQFLDFFNFFFISLLFFYDGLSSRIPVLYSLVASDSGYMITFFSRSIHIILSRYVESF
jgi:hypothetical protein